MYKLLAALIAGAFASVAAAQTPDPKMTTKEKQERVQAVTKSSAFGSTGPGTAKMQETNVKRSKDVAKMTTAEKNKAMKEANKSMANPENPTGGVATAAQQKTSVAESKAMPKQNTEMKTKEGQKQLQKGLEKAASQ